MRSLFELYIVSRHGALTQHSGSALHGLCQSRGHLTLLTVPALSTPGPVLTLTLDLLRAFQAGHGGAVRSLLGAGCGIESLTDQGAHNPVSVSISVQSAPRPPFTGWDI